MNLDQLREILAGCAGTTGEEFDECGADASFDQLGYDSLVILDAAARVQQVYGLVIPDEVATSLSTPTAMLAAANAQRENNSV